MPRIFLVSIRSCVFIFCWCLFLLPFICIFVPRTRLLDERMIYNEWKIRWAFPFHRQQNCVGFDLIERYGIEFCTAASKITVISIHFNWNFELINGIKYVSIYSDFGNKLIAQKNINTNRKQNISHLIILIQVIYVK